LNGLLPGYGLPRIDWERDVRARSMAAEGGSVTERHLLFAVAHAIVQTVGTGKGLVPFLRDTIGIAVPPRLATYLADPGNQFLLFDLLGLLKSSFIEKVYIQPDDSEVLPVERVVRFAEDIGGIPAYAYLGDVADSPTGDKKAEKFEDGYLDLLMEEARRLGFRAITYMPPRNTIEQLLRVQKLCAKLGFMEISGVDINSPRQSFNCPELRRPEFSHLMTATWALIAHELLSGVEPRYGLFHPDNPLAGRPLGERIAEYAKVGMALDPHHTADAAASPLVAGWGG
ncbi:MAG TPA: PHP domain-containing protein, partial [Spirochaetia bacterium]